MSPKKALDFEAEARLVTPEEARQLLREDRWPGQRVLKEWHVIELGEAMEAGDFSVTDLVHLAVLGDKEWMINGQHTLAAVDYWGKPVKLNVQRTFVTCDEDIEKLYYRSDAQVPRTLSDAFKATNLTEELKIPPAWVNALGSATGMIIADFAQNGARGLRRLRSRDARVAASREWADPCHSYIEALSPIPKVLTKILKQRWVMGVALVTMRHAPDPARKFWGMVSHDHAVGERHPARALREYMLMEKSSIVSPRHKARLVALAWGHYVAGTEVSILKCPLPENPIIIAKSPWTAAKGKASEMSRQAVKSAAMQKAWEKRRALQKQNEKELATA